ncbi:protein TPX2-like isoform X2 [Tripterygium wilfordii]|uniref:protein TPX2-like isoform X2 n=1 Tax=Tripterygium wilfordii TaxID=458696 RepID=UPI0018F83060|nr:protein TPX2-like isoform X2 [Tripterygium wilfordii]
MAVAEESSDDSGIMIDGTYEFSAPRFFDFVKGETDEDKRKAELWFDNGLSYAPSPFMPRIKTARSVKVDTLCDFSEADQMQKGTESSYAAVTDYPLEIKLQSNDKTTESKGEKVIQSEPEEENEKNLVEISAVKEAACGGAFGGQCKGEDPESGSGSKDKTTESKGGQVIQSEPKVENEKNLVIEISSVKEATCGGECKGDAACHPESGSGSIGRSSSTNEKINSVGRVGAEACTPRPTMTSRNGELQVTDSKKHQTARKIASLVQNPSAFKPKTQLQSKVKSAKPSSVTRGTNVKKSTGTPSLLAQDNQAIKRQKLEGGRSRQILTVKPPPNLPHKSKAGLTSSSSGLCYAVGNKINKEDRKEPVAPFVSMAEMMKKFQSSTRDLSLPYTNRSLSHDDKGSVIQSNPTLSLTRPKEPEFETAQRIRLVKVKSSAELEEEMMAKIPKFKARPLNKKILEEPTLPVLPRSTPQPPQFQEFHFMRMARAKDNEETASVASSILSRQTTTNQWKHHLTYPKTPVLQTSLRARTPKVKSSFELEQEELEKVPKFKARPLNKKIFESKGELGIFCNAKKHVTKPQEFHFATNERIPPATAVIDLFDKLSLNSEPCHDKPLPRNTTPNPFHLHTEERGVQKERKYVTEIMQKQLEDERARIPRAKPYPYTTDYPVIPPKPEPKQCTKPEPFQLESLVRHEEEMQKEAEERRRKEEEEAKLRIFKAQPVLKEDPIPLPEKVRKPLTQVHKINLHVDHRAVDRAEFDHKIKEKEMIYKRYREESEAAKMIEEEKAWKQLRRTMVPHARPMPSFDNPFCPQKACKEPTKPKSPKLRVTKRKERRRVISTLTPVSSSASNMR